MAAGSVAAAKPAFNNKTTPSKGAPTAATVTTPAKPAAPQKMKAAAPASAGVGAPIQTKMFAPSGPIGVPAALAPSRAMPTYTAAELAADVIDVKCGVRFAEVGSDEYYSPPYPDYPAIQYSTYASSKVYDDEDGGSEPYQWAVACVSFASFSPPPS